MVFLQIILTPCWSVLNFWKFKLENQVRRTGFLFISNLIFTVWFFKIQVQINRGQVFFHCCLAGQTKLLRTQISVGHLTFFWLILLMLYFLALFFDVIFWRYFWRYFLTLYFDVLFWRYFLTLFFDIIFCIIFMTLSFDVIFWWVDG